MGQSSLISRLSDLLNKAADEAVLPRFGRLLSHQIEEKTAGEIVTVADRDAERILADGLRVLYPNARIIGEEAAAASPDIMNAMDDGDVWLIDPIDGTGNFAAGREPFAIMIALLRDGEIVLSVIADPISKTVLAAEKGAGAYAGNTRVRVDQSAVARASLTGAVFTRFMPSTLRDEIAPRAATVARIVPGLMCAGAEYPAVGAGSRHFAIFWRTLPWDHAPGALFLTEAGGCVERLDGTTYRPANGQSGLLVARNRAVADDIAQNILPAGTQGSPAF
jgi:fructose-1,6-bisphosphatase/inositol monophosphatase family enzyme